MWRKPISLATVLIISIACGSFGNPTPTPQESSSSQANIDSSNSEEGVENTILTLDSLETIPPSDIIQEIGFFGGMGGGDAGCFDTDFQSPTFYWVIDYPYEWMWNISIILCGLKVGEEVRINVALPDGTTSESIAVAYQTESKNTGEITYEYLPFIYAPTGDYLFTFSGIDWSLEYPLKVIEPPVTRFYLYESQLLLINFSPNETIRLFVYNSHNSSNAKLIGWKEFLIGNSGDLILNIEDESAGYVVLGDLSGQFSVNLEPSAVYCKGARNPSGVIPNGYAQILTDKLPTYTFDTNQKTWVASGVLNAKKGTIVRITANAMCGKGTFLWNIECIDNSCQYATLVPESGPEGYYLSPLEEIPPTLNVPPVNIISCPGTLPSRLFVGAKAEVTMSGMAPQLSLRAQPSMSAEKVHVIAAGRDMDILDGPVCADGSYWWYIRSEQGFEGWSREGDSEDYWIDPLP